MLIVGSNKSDIIRHLPDSFLLIDDGPLIDALPAQKQRGTHLDLSTHSLNPLQGMSYPRARDFVSIIDAIFPEGESTLTKKASRFQLLKALSEGGDWPLITPDKNEAGTVDAYLNIQTLLLSPVLKPFLTRPTNLSLNGVLLARLDRTKLPEFDCFVIANFLISNFKGHVIVPDFGFYGCPFHSSLMRQGRLRAGVNFLDESPLKNQLLLFEDKVAASCTAKDARTIAQYLGLIEGTNAFTDYVDRSVSSNIP